MKIYSEDDNKLFEEYTRKFEINKYYNQIISDFNEFFEINIKTSQFDKNQKKDEMKLEENKLPINLQYNNDKIKKYQLLYLNKLLYEKINSIKEEILEKHLMFKDNYIRSLSLLESLKVINEVLIDLKQFTLNIDELFNEYLKDSNNNIILKKHKVSETNLKIVSEEINVEKIKNIIDTLINSNKKINISDEEPCDFLFQLFKLKIGFPI